jgi:hypothetical protein
MEDLFPLTGEQNGSAPRPVRGAGKPSDKKSPVGKKTPRCAHPRDAVPRRSSRTGDFAVSDCEVREVNYQLTTESIPHRSCLTPDTARLA